jgi:phosphoserine phosphatase
MIKAVLLDFDGTLVTEDILTIITDVVGKKAESEKLNEEFRQGISKGLTGLINRINLLTGVPLDLIEKQLGQKDYLMPGAKELMDYLNAHGIISILGSGNILPVLKFYQQKLGITHIIGSNPKIENNCLAGISLDDYSDSDFKLTESIKILEQLHISPQEVIAIGDSIGDKSRFQFAYKSIAVNAKDDIKQLASYVVNKDLREIIPIIEKIN